MQYYKNIHDMMTATEQGQQVNNGIKTDPGRGATVLPFVYSIEDVDEMVGVSHNWVGYEVVVVGKEMIDPCQAVARYLDSHLQKEDRTPGSIHPDQKESILHGMFLEARREVYLSEATLEARDELLRHPDRFVNFAYEGTSMRQVAYLCELAADYVEDHIAELGLQLTDEHKTAYALGALFAHRAGMIDLYRENGVHAKDECKRVEDRSYGVRELFEKANEVKVDPNQSFNVTCARLTNPYGVSTRDSDEVRRVIPQEGDEPSIRRARVGKEAAWQSC